MIRPLPSLIAALLIGVPALGQAGQGQPVDRAVGDLDPRATSFRRVEPGLAVHSRAAALRTVDRAGWQQRGGVPIDPLTGLPLPQGFVYEAPGFRAYMPQAEYVVRSPTDPYSADRNVAPAADGQYVTVAPANMVYDLVPRTPRRDPRSPNPAAVDHRLDARLDARLAPLPAGGGVGNIDHADGVTLRSPRQNLLDLYRAGNRNVSGQQAPPQQQRPQQPTPPRSRPQQQVVDQPDPAQPRRDQRNHPPGE